jgi:hypothetical protein
VAAVVRKLDFYVCTLQLWAHISAVDLDPDLFCLERDVEVCGTIFGLGVKLEFELWQNPLDLRN